MIDRNLRIVKLGGSLLDLADLPGMLRRWLAKQPTAASVFVVGGGRLADVVREYDRLHGLSVSEAHWLAIRTMELNSRLVAALFMEAEWLDSFDAENRFTSLGILNPYRFMRDDQRSGNPLPATWHVTSDSIAARAAEHTGASELVLLKSSLPPPATTIEAAVASGYVDRMFPDASRQVPRIRAVNLREPTFPEVVWRRRALEQSPRNE